MKNRIGASALLISGILTALTGCAMTESAESSTPKAVGTRSIDDVDAATKEISSQILDVIAVKGKMSKSGPGVSTCEGAERGKLFIMRHPWSLTGPSDAELMKAMTRLKEDLPKHGWKITKYGRNSSKAKSLEMTADHAEKKFAVNIEFWEKGGGGDTNEPTLVVNVVSACHQVPKGEEVDRY